MPSPARMACSYSSATGEVGDDAAADAGGVGCGWSASRSGPSAAAAGATRPRVARDRPRVTGPVGTRESASAVKVAIRLCGIVRWLATGVAAMRAARRSDGSAYAGRGPGWYAVLPRETGRPMAGCRCGRWTHARRPPPARVERRPRSATRSSAASIPTDRRISASGPPASGEAATETWVIDRRHLDQRLDAAERLRQGEEPGRLADGDRPLARRSARGAPPAAGTNETMPPKRGSPPSRIWRAGDRRLRVRVRPVGEPRVAHPRDVVARRRGTRATASAFAACRSIRRASVRSPRRTRKQSNGPGTAPIAFWRNRRRSATSSSRVTATP